MIVLEHIPIETVTNLKNIVEEFFDGNALINHILNKNKLTGAWKNRFSG
jgi:hypothetical protein